MKTPRHALLALLGLAAGAALAQPAAQASAQEDARWEIGAVAVGISQQAWPGASAQVQRALAVPYVFYRGPWLRIDRDALGLRAVKTDRFELDIGFAGALGSNASDIEARRGMPDLGTLVEFGPRAKWLLGGTPASGRWRVELPLRGVFDLESRFASRGFSLEPELQYEHEQPGAWRLSAGLGALLGDRRLAEQLYGVAPAYATATRPAYTAQAGLIAWRLSLTASRPLGPDWRIFGFTRLDSVAGAANAGSPLVSRQLGATAGLGLQWTWMRSSQRGAD